MTDKKNFNQDNDIDRFWDLELLLPKTEKTVYIPGSPKDTSAADLEIPGDDENIPAEKLPQRPENTHNAPVSETVSFDKWLSQRRDYEQKRYVYGKKVVNEYIPNDSLIKKVTVCADTGTPRLCERFLADAERLFGMNGEFHGNVPFESYYPQYSQLNEKQLECYIGFRTLIRKGIFPEVDRAYIYLYLYENINHTARLSPEERADNICSLIKAYPGCDVKLFTDMCNWLCDICLIYNVRLSPGIFGDIYSRVLSCSSVKEFYLSLEDSGVKRAFLLNTSRYNWEKSRFYKSNKELYDKHINASVNRVLSELSKTDPRYSENGTELCTLIHESYSGALCVSAVKRTISLECLCLTRAEAVRKTVTELVKYSENCLRDLLGIRHKLSIGYVLTSNREIINKYYAENTRELHMLRQQSKSAAPGRDLPPDYEKQYEPENHGISFEEAEKIERESWKITERLVSDTTDDIDNSSVEKDASPQNLITDTTPSKENNIREKLISGLEALRLGDQKLFVGIARNAAMLPDALADEINEFAFDYVGDNILEYTENGYKIIPDYLSDAEALIMENNR